MPAENPRYEYDVDALMEQVTVEQVAAFYGVALPGLHPRGRETRMACFLNCGKTVETGDRAMAIQMEHRVKIWRCHQYGCGKGGNLVTLCHLMKPGGDGTERPRGERFKAILRDLNAMIRGEVSSTVSTAPTPQTKPSEPKKPVVNVPLVRSENERVRALVNLDEKFVTDVGRMPPKAAAYFRRRPRLTPEVCQKWRMGYLPRDSGDDNRGGTMRGKIVYPILSELGEVLTWFGRDPEYEDKHRKWIAGGRQGREPQKFHFVKGFHRGLEVLGQQARRLAEPDYRQRLAEIGVLVVEGPNDVVALDDLGQPAVALCSNAVTAEQARKIVTWARRLARNCVTLMLDCDEEGENGAKQTLWELARQGVDVRLAWSREMFRGVFAGRQPESLCDEEWSEIRANLTRRS